MSKVSFKRVWKDRVDGELIIDEKLIEISKIIHETDEMVLGGDFMFFVNGECEWCSLKEFDNQEQS